MIGIERIKSIKGKLSGFIDHHDVAEPTIEELIIIIDELIAIHELKGDQVPYAWVRISQNGVRNYSSFYPRPRKGNGDAFPLFTAPQKPVVLPDYWNDGRVDVMRKDCVIAVIEAAGVLVKDGE